MKNPEAYFYRGDAYQKQGLCDKAIADYKKAISLDPGYLEAYINRSYTFKKKNLREEAIADFQKQLLSVRSNLCQTKLKHLKFKSIYFNKK